MKLHELIERLQEAAQRLGTEDPMVTVEMIDTTPCPDKSNRRAAVTEIEHSSGRLRFGGWEAPCIVIRG